MYVETSGGEWSVTGVYLYVGT